MWGQLVAFSVTIVLVVAGVWRGQRWHNKHKHDLLPAIPVVSGVSAFTGEIIASGEPNTELGSGAPPECGTP